MASNTKKTLLLIDDEETFCLAVKDYLESDRLEVITAHTRAEGLEACSHCWVDVALLDQRLPDGDGHSLVPELLKKNEQCKIVFITAHPTVENAVTAVRAGAYDYLLKPVDLGEVRITVENALRTLELEQVEQIHAYERERDRERLEVIGLSGGLARTSALIESAAASDAPVLITGETGTGKSLVARAVHHRGPARRSTLLSVNCAALPETLIEAELFGHERGAFTGAAAARRGLFEMADGGTIFLDEIGEMPMRLQAKLLGVIEDRTVRRIGGAAARPVDVKIIAATNSDLESSLGKTFRRDLFFRLNVIRIHIPPLRERRGDIRDLCACLLRQISAGRSLELPGEEVDKLMAYDWPGNVRELKNVLERAALLHKGGVIRPSLLLDQAAEEQRVRQAADRAAITPLADVERELILSVLSKLSGNMTHTADALGISLSTLKRRLRDYGIIHSPRHVD